MSPARRCSRTACGRSAVATLTYVYADQTAVLGPLATYAEPHAYDLCEVHSERLSAPRGWEVLRLARDTAEPGPVQRRPARAGRRGPRGGPPAAPAGADHAGHRGRPRGRAPRPPARAHHRQLRLTPAARAPTRLRPMGAGIDPGVLAATFKAYDVRGTVPDQVDEHLARLTGGAFVALTAAGRRRRRPRHASELAVAGRRLRRGRGRRRRRRGHDRPGLHRPALLRLRPPRRCRARCSPRATTPRSTTGSSSAAPTPSRSAPTPGWPRSATTSRRGDVPVSTVPGEISQQDVLEAYAAHLLRLAPVTGRRLKVVVDAGNGMAGLTAPAVFGRLGGDRVEVVPMYFELDGTFPHHEANPIEPDQPRRPPGPRRRRGGRPRARLRRRRRPLLPRRRARRRGLAVHAHRADRRPRARQAPRLAR